MTDARRPAHDPTPGAVDGVGQDERADEPATGSADQTPAAPVDAAGDAPATDGDAEADTDAGDPEREIDLDTLAETDPRSRPELLGALLQAEHERDEYLDDLRRSHADFENYRKRVMRESATQRELGKVQVIEGLLETLDDLDRTIAAAENSTDASLAKGVELVANKLVGALQNAGVARVDVTGVPFDPEVHEAVQQVPADDPEAADGPVVSQILRPGYTLGERTLRAAMVVVAQ